MSDYEHKKGRLIPMYKEDKEDDKTYFKRVQGDNFDEETWDEEDGDIQEYFSMTGSDGFIYNNNLWRDYHGGDGMDTAIDPTYSNKVYGFMQNGQNLFQSN